MGAVLGVVYVAASFGAVPAATPPGGATENSMQVGLVQELDCGDTALAPFLRERLAGSGRLAPAGSHPRLGVVVGHGVAQPCAVTITRDGAVLAYRELEPGSDRTSMHLAAWLFVRSTLERARASAGLPAPVAVTTGDTAPAAAAATPASEPASGADPAPPAGRTVSADRPSSTAAELTPAAAVPPLPVALAAPLETPRGLQITGASVGFCAAAGPGSQWSAGPCASVAARPGTGASGWAELGYALSPGQAGITVHRLAVSFALAFDPPWMRQLELGALVQVSPKLGVADARGRWAVGVDLGPVVRLTSGPIVARVGWAWAAMRQRWVGKLGVREDAPWTLTAGAGVAWP